MATEQEQYDVASWRVGDEPRIYFAVTALHDSQKNRIIEHERPYREGAKLDDMGSVARRWRMSIVWNATLAEKGLELNGKPLFPDVLRDMQRIADSVHKTGDLVVPGLGNVRARLETFDTAETEDELDTARTEATFIQDNEESLDRTLIRAPTARATTQRVADQTTFSAQAAGHWTDDLEDLSDFAAEVEGALQEPGRAINKVQTQVRRNRRAIERMIDAGHQTAQDVGGPLLEPANSEVERLAVLLLDRQASAADERQSSQPATVPFVIDVPRTSIFEVAARLNQDAADLLDLNDAVVADPLELHQGETILVYQTTGA